MFDDSVDLVVWGHEHDCRIVPEPVAGKNYYITQPGSSVATSLADGEAIEKSESFIRPSNFKLTGHYIKACSASPGPREGVQVDSHPIANSPPLCH